MDSPEAEPVVAGDDAVVDTIHRHRSRFPTAAPGKHQPHQERQDPLRIVFAGTPTAAVPSLAALLESAHEIAAVITRPAARRGRGRSINASPVAELASAAGI